MLADTDVTADSVSHLVHVGARCFAKGTDGVDAADALSQECVGDKLGQLGRPQVGGNDTGAINPLGIHCRESGSCLEALRRLLRADQHAAGLGQVLDGGALGQELGVGQDLELDACVGSIQHALHGVGSADGDSRLLHLAKNSSLLAPG